MEIIRTKWHGTRFPNKNVAVISADAHMWRPTLGQIVENALSSCNVEMHTIHLFVVGWSNGQGYGRLQW